MIHKGWHSRGYLPHLDAQGVVQHVVLRTADSISASQIENLRHLSPQQQRHEIDAALDISQNGHIFEDDFCAKVVEAQLLYFNSKRYDLIAWCIMPNHIHVLICSLATATLGQIVRTWKVGTTQAINAYFDAKQTIFAPDYFDRFMRNGHQTLRAIGYIENNPVAAGFCVNPEDWRFSSAWHHAQGWEPKTSNLPLTIN